MTVSLRWTVGVLMGAGLSTALWGAAGQIRVGEPVTPSQVGDAAEALHMPAEWGCGRSALWSLAASRDREAADQLSSIYAREGDAVRTPTSLEDLVQIGRRAGLELTGLHVAGTTLARVALPAVAHVAPRHFVTLLAVDAEWATVLERGRRSEWPRAEFDRRFTGYLLCLADRGRSDGDIRRKE